jgi:hypothetical protein
MPFPFFEKLHEDLNQLLDVRWEMLVRRWHRVPRFLSGTVDESLVMRIALVLLWQLSSTYCAAAGLQGSMGTVLRPIAPVDQDFLDALIVRWKLAERYVEDLEMDSLPAERALTSLVQHDVPMLLSEIIRLRPELG